MMDLSVEVQIGEGAREKDFQWGREDSYFHVLVKRRVLLVVLLVRRAVCRVFL